MTDQPTKAPRTTHTPAERATEAVAVLQRRLDKLTKSKAALELSALELEPQIESMQKRLDYALSNPDLPPKAPQFEETPLSTAKLAVLDEVGQAEVPAPTA
jgi:hypothetical protein